MISSLFPFWKIRVEPSVIQGGASTKISGRIGGGSAQPSTHFDDGAGWSARIAASAVPGITRIAAPRPGFWTKPGKTALGLGDRGIGLGQIALMLQAGILHLQTDACC
jgi:hypothetical protein